MSVPGGHVGHYVHSDTKLGVLIALGGVDGSMPEVHTLGRDLAMQIAAAAPDFLTRDEVPADKINAAGRLSKSAPRLKASRNPQLPRSPKAA
ncbi:MAG: hypothetical protein IPG71_11395 [bacterium]|nr:hypothetical protein [bacterium]